MSIYSISLLLAEAEKIPNVRHTKWMKTMIHLIIYSGNFERKTNNGTVANSATPDNDSTKS